MEKYLDLSRATRSNFLRLLETLNLEQLNKIPAGFNNNIIWNFGHIISSQQSLCYTLSGLTPKIDHALVMKYKKGSTPEQYVEQEEIRELKLLLMSTIEETEKDFKTGAFKDFKPYTTSMGITLNSIEDVIRFIPVHDGIHFGYAMAMRKLV